MFKKGDRVRLPDGRIAYFQAQQPDGSYLVTLTVFEVVTKPDTFKVKVDK